MAKKIVFALFVVSILFLGFTVGRYTDFMPMTRASWAAKSNQEFNKLDETGTALALAVAAASPEIAQELIKNMKTGDVSSEAIKSVQKLASRAMSKSKKKQAKRERPSFEEEMAEVKEFEVIKNSFMTGKKNAPIQIVIFDEFLCPYCARVDPVLHKVVDEYGEKVNFIYQSFIIHGERALYWHKFAYAAGKQGKFWEVTIDLFATQREWIRMPTEEAMGKVIEPMAKKFKLNLAKLKKDMEDESIKKQIDEESALARELGVRGTPNIFINGRAFRGARDEAFYRKVIDKLLSE